MSQLFPRSLYEKLTNVALLVGRAEEPRPRLIPTPTTVARRHSLPAIGVLGVVPLVVFGVPALLGHPVMPSDDLTQNYPLRVLVGAQLRQGQLPLFDPYIWSGAPLLGGWNAGAAYPLTLLFAVMSGATAWTINLIVTWWVAGLGTFAFLRASRLSPVASFLGGLTFAFTGAMAAQVPHFGLVAGMSWVPVALLAVLKLSESRRLRGRLAWTCALAGAGAMVILAGEPRAIDDAVVVIAPYVLWRAWRLGRAGGLVPYLGFVAGGVVLGAAIGAVQWFPGIDAVQTSQRALHSTALFDSGSLAPKWLFLSVVPTLLGGSGSFGQPTFFGHYSLAEVTGYVGIMPLVAAFALLGRLRRRARLPEWFLWHGVALLGVLLALGGNTVLGPVLFHLPLFGDQRLQSRNILIADLALAVLLAYWADLWLRSPRPARRWFVPARQLLGLVPAVLVVGVVTVTLAWGAGMLRWLGLTAGMANKAGPMAPWLVPFLVIGLGAVALVLWGQRLGHRHRARLLVAFVAADVLVFTLLTTVTLAPGLTRSHPPARAASTTASAPKTTTTPTAPVVPLRDLVGSGRFAIYDPGLYDGAELSALGVPDTNLLSETPSVEGYSSIVDSTYAQLTGSHQAMGEGQNVLDPEAIADGTLDQLDTTVLVTPPSYLTTSVRAGQAPAPGTIGRRRLAPGQSTQWYLGTSLDATSITIPVRSPMSASTPPVRVGLVGGSGSTRWTVPSVVAGELVVSLAAPGDIVAVRVDAGATSIDLDPPTVTTAPGGLYRADGELQDALVPPRWRFGGMDGAFAVFDDSMARAALTVAAPRNGSTAGVQVRASAGPASSPTRAQVSSPHGATVVRAVAWIPGWTATWRASGTTGARPLVVARSGLVQAVTVPAGRGTITWSYVPPGERLGLGISAGGLVVVAGLAIGVLGWRRRSRRRPPGPRVSAVVSPLRGGDPAERRAGALVGARFTAPAPDGGLPLG
jgi:hypothetical protein